MGLAGVDAAADEPTPTQSDPGWPPIADWAQASSVASADHTDGALPDGALPDVDDNGTGPRHDDPIQDPIQASLSAARSPDAAASDIRTQIELRVGERRRMAQAAATAALQAKAATGAKAPAGATGRRRAPTNRRPTVGQSIGKGPKHRVAHRGGALRQYAIFGLLTALLVFILRTFVVASFYIPSGSMEPTLHGCPTCEPDLVMVDKLSYRFHAVSRGDVVVFDRPPGLAVPVEDTELIKRVIGLPGETVSGHDGSVYIGGRALVEPYVRAECHGTMDFAATIVPADHYFMMGDNRCDSTDSRVFGVIARATMVGRAFAVVWPLKHLRWL